MSPLHCNTVSEALWERAASAGPEPLTPALVDHLSNCGQCQAERRAVRELIDISRLIPDPAPPIDIWDGFEEELDRQLSVRVEPAPWQRWSQRAVGFAAVLAFGFALGAVAMRDNGPDQTALATDRTELLAELQADLANDAQLESYLDDIEGLLVAYQAAHHGDAVETFRQSLPATMVAGAGVPSDAARARLEVQREAREQLRTVVLGMLTSEIEAERRGFGYLERRVAEIAGQRLLLIP
jgi:enamine deaminase RidA (YjgF/YER057c/UK114 family)